MTAKNAFWIRLIEKLNSGGDMPQAIAEVLQELCIYFGFGYGFVYQADYAGVFHLAEHAAMYPGCRLPEQIDFPRAFSPALARELTEKQYVFFRNGTAPTALSERLSALFHTRSLLLVPILDELGAPIALVGIGDRRGVRRMRRDDVTFTYSVLSTVANYVKLRVFEEKIGNAERSLETVLDNMGADIYVTDFFTQEILYLNQSMAAQHGGAAQLIGKPCWQVLYEGQQEECSFCPREKLTQADGTPAGRYDWDFHHPCNGRWYRCLSQALQWTDGRPVLIISNVDITGNKKNEEIIRRMAEYDCLTGLPNRLKLTKDCEALLPVLEAEDKEGYLLFFDLDGFKAVNDTYGHRTGDALLTQVGERLQANPLLNGRCYRYGGDEFVILLDGERPNSLESAISILQECLSRPFHLEAGELCCSASVGVSLCSQCGYNASELLRKADQAMYLSKRLGGGQVRVFGEAGEHSPAYGSRLHLQPGRAVTSRN